jgi:hypothetical protein
LRDDLLRHTGYLLVWATKLNRKLSVNILRLASEGSDSVIFDYSQVKRRRDVKYASFEVLKASLAS